jgi:hypothetical protein
MMVEIDDDLSPADTHRRLGGRQDLMPDMSHLPTMLGTIPGWITAAATSGGLWKLLQWQLDNRKQRQAEKGDDRDGFGVLIEALQRDALLVREQHRSCEERLSAMSLRMDGMQAQLRAAQLSFARLMPTSPEIDGMLDQLGRVDDKPTP